MTAKKIAPAKVAEPELKKPHAKPAKTATPTKAAAKPDAKPATRPVAKAAASPAAKAGAKAAVSPAPKAGAKAALAQGKAGGKPPSEAGKARDVAEEDFSDVEAEFGGEPET